MYVVLLSSWPDNKHIWSQLPDAPHTAGERLTAAQISIKAKGLSGAGTPHPNCRERRTDDLLKERKVQVVSVPTQPPRSTCNAPVPLPKSRERYRSDLSERRGKNKSRDGRCLTILPGSKNNRRHMRHVFTGTVPKSTVPDAWPEEQTKKNRGHAVRVHGIRAQKRESRSMGQTRIQKNTATIGAGLRESPKSDTRRLG